MCSTQPRPQLSAFQVCFSFPSYVFWYWFQMAKKTNCWMVSYYQCEDLHSKGVDVLVTPQNLAWAQHLVGGVPNLFPSPPLLSWHAQCRRKRVVKTTYKVLQKCCMSKTSTPLKEDPHIQGVDILLIQHFWSTLQVLLMTRFRLHCACQERSGGKGNKFGTPLTRCWAQQDFEVMSKMSTPLE